MKLMNIYFVAFFISGAFVDAADVVKDRVVSGAGSKTVPEDGSFWRRYLQIQSFSAETAAPTPIPLAPPVPPPTTEGPTSSTPTTQIPAPLPAPVPPLPPPISTTPSPETAAPQTTAPASPVPEPTPSVPVTPAPASPQPTPSAPVTPAPASPVPQPTPSAPVTPAPASPVQPNPSAPLTPAPVAAPIPEPGSLPPSSTVGCNVTVGITCETTAKEACDAVMGRYPGTCNVGVEINQMEFMFTQCNCECSDNLQGLATACVDVMPFNDTVVTITCSGVDGSPMNVTPTQVMEDDIFAVSNPTGGSLPDTLVCYFSQNGAIAQTLSIDTSGNSTLYLLDQFGALQVVSCGEQTCVESLCYDYVIDNVGTSSMDLTRADRVYDGVSESFLGVLNATSLSPGESAVIGECHSINICGSINFTTEVLVEADSSTSGLMCEASAMYTASVTLPAPPIPPPPPPIMFIPPASQPSPSPGAPVPSPTSGAPVANIPTSPTSLPAPTTAAPGTTSPAPVAPSPSTSAPGTATATPVVPPIPLPGLPTAPPAVGTASPAPSSTTAGASPAPSATTTASLAPSATSVAGSSAPSATTTASLAPSATTVAGSSAPSATTAAGSPAPSATTGASPAPSVTAVPPAPAPSVGSPAPSVTAGTSPAPSVTAGTSPAPSVTAGTSPAPSVTAGTSPAPSTAAVPPAPAPTGGSPAPSATTSVGSPVPSDTAGASSAPSTQSSSSSEACQIAVDLDCTLADGQACDSIAPKTPGSCTTPVEILQFLFTNCTCGCTENEQGDAASCNFTKAFDGTPVSVACADATGDALNVTPSQVMEGGLFTVDNPSGDALPGTVVCSFSQSDEVLQTISFDASESASLALLNKFGTAQVVSCDEETCIQNTCYSYTVENTGNVTTDITTADRTFNGATVSFSAALNRTNLGVGENSVAKECRLLDVCKSSSSATKVIVEGEATNGSTCQADATFTFNITRARRYLRN